jgi:molybdenum cofactor cytidylyltransferase
VSGKIAAVVLAAGASSRMGPLTNKLLLAVDGVPMIRRTVERAQRAGCEPVVVVVGHEPERVRETLAGLAVLYAVNPNFTGPTSGSLHAGLRALPAEADAAVVLLADMVLVTAEMIGALVDAAKADAAPLHVSRYGEVLAPPLLFRRALWPELLAWSGEGCGKAVVTEHRGDATLHDWPVVALADIDTPDDYRTLTVSQ